MQIADFGLAGSYWRVYLFFVHAFAVAHRKVRPRFSGASKVVRTTQFPLPTDAVNMSATHHPPCQLPE